MAGRKDELIHRIESYLQESISSNQLDHYDKIRAAIYRVSCLPYHAQPPCRTFSTNRYPTTSPAAPISSSSSHRAAASIIDFGSAPLTHSFDHPQPKPDPIFGTTSTPSMMRPGAFPTGNNPQMCAHSSGLAVNPIPSFLPRGHAVLPSFSNSTSFNPRTIPIIFAKSPFYRIDSAASTVAICHRAAQNDRKSVPLSLVISPEQRSRLTQSASNASGSQYQLRMFATSEAFYDHPSCGGTTNPSSFPPALVEFPTTTDIKLNSSSITSNLKGIKKQPGTAPPPNLALVPGRNGVGQALDLKEGRSNQLEIAYSNSDKRFFFVIYLVEYFGVYGLLRNLKSTRKRTEEQVLREIISTAGDEDVMTSASAISLKDPVVFSRIKTPIRSTKCKHLQCFDAEMFFTMMEQTPTWLCPVCNSKLNNDEIAIDEYFESILKATPSSIDSVIVEADGKWHDERNRYGTGKKKPGPQSGMSAGSRSTSEGHQVKEGSQDYLCEDVSDAGAHNLKRKITVLELESDDEDEEEEDDDDDNSFVDYSRRPLDKRHKSLGHSADCVIDLTLDDD